MAAEEKPQWRNENIESVKTSISISKMQRGESKWRRISEMAKHRRKKWHQRRRKRQRRQCNQHGGESEGVAKAKNRRIMQSKQQSQRISHHGDIMA
jgi:hypothetical protein